MLGWVQHHSAQILIETLTFIGYLSVIIFCPSGNLHKWLFAPRGCAILWVSPKFHDVVVPQVVSWLHDKTLQDRFFQQGTVDHTPYTSAGIAIKFYNEVGGMVSTSQCNIHVDCKPAVTH